MRPDFLTVFDAHETLLPYSNLILDAAAFFQGELASVQQIKRILEAEYLRSQEAEKGRYRPSQVANALLEMANKRSQAVETVGRVGLAMLGHTMLGEHPSLGMAIKKTAEAVSDSPRIPFRFWDIESERPKVKPRDMASSENAVRRCLTEYRRVIHICAARVALNCYAETLPPFGMAPAEQKIYVDTVAVYQVFFDRYDRKERHPKSTAFDLLLLELPGGYQLPEIPILPTRDFMVNVLKFPDSPA